MLVRIVRFLLLALTDLAMIPALNIMKRNRRHFELFVGVLHLGVSFIFNAAEALDTELFLKENEWHFISDVLSVSYFLMLCVHVMDYKNENHNIVLRYVAFAGAWITKTKDDWSSVIFQALLVICYLLGVFYRRTFTPGADISPLIKQNVTYAMGCLAALLVVLIVIVFFDEDDSPDALGLAMGMLHITAGALFYYAWLSVPCMDSKKDDIIPKYSSYV